MALIFDTHAHLHDEAFNEDLEALLPKLREAGVGRVVLPGSDLEDSRRAVEIARPHPGLYAAIGVHPHEAESWNEETEAELVRLYEAAQDSGREALVLAIGEIGLDYHYDFSPREVQKAVYRKQLELASRLSLPVIVHEREAFQDSYEILAEAKADGLLENGLVCHCFSGSPESAKLLLDLGFYLGFDGPVTFKKAKKPLEVLKIMPKERILLETDSPYLTPVPFRGRRNDPSHIAEIEAKAAEVLGMEPEALRAQCWENACRFYRLPLEGERL